MGTKITGTTLAHTDQYIVLVAATKMSHQSIP